jgi:hypothetical protein
MKALASRQLLLGIAGNGVLRVEGGASSVLVGVYIAELAGRGHTPQRIVVQ